MKITLKSRFATLNSRELKPAEVSLGTLAFSCQHLERLRSFITESQPLVVEHGEALILSSPALSDWACRAEKACVASVRPQTEVRRVRCSHFAGDYLPELLVNSKRVKRVWTGTDTPACAFLYCMRTVVISENSRVIWRTQVEGTDGKGREEGIQFVPDDTETWEESRTRNEKCLI